MNMLTSEDVERISSAVACEVALSGLEGVASRSALIGVAAVAAIREAAPLIAANALEDASHKMLGPNPLAELFGEDAWRGLLRERAAQIRQGARP